MHGIPFSHLAGVEPQVLYYLNVTTSKTRATRSASDPQTLSSSITASEASAAEVNMKDPMDVDFPGVEEDPEDDAQLVVKEQQSPLALQSGMLVGGLLWTGKLQLLEFFTFLVDLGISFPLLKL